MVTSSADTKITIEDLEEVKSKLTIITECGICEEPLANPVVVIALDTNESGKAQLPTVIDENCASQFDTV